MIRIGTSGYSYKDWIGEYYPQGTKDNEMLSYYARDFSTTEINFTYYRLPNPFTLKAMADKVPDGFVFSVKASKELTHEREDVAPFQQFVAALQPMIEQNKFGTVLAQFPNSFKPSDENRD